MEPLLLLIRALAERYSHRAYMQLWLYRFGLLLTLSVLVAGCGRPVDSMSVVSPTHHSPIAGAPVETRAFVDVNVIPMDSERILRDYTVLIQNGRIVALGPAEELPVPVGAAQVNGRNKYLIPGLVDMHVHLIRRAEGSYPDTAALERRLFQLVAHGVTTIRNMDFTDAAEVVLRYKSRATTGKLLSPRIYTSGELHNLAMLAELPASKRIRNADDLDALILQQLPRFLANYQAAGYDHLKIYAPSLEFFDSLVGIVRRLKMPLVGHPPERVNQKVVSRLDRALAAPMKSIEHLESYLWTDSPPLTHAKIMALAAATRRAGVWFTPTRRWYDAYWAQYERMGFDSTAFPIMADLTVAMQEAGVGLLLGTDGPATWVVEELAALVRMGLTPYQALVTATRNPAAYFGTLDDNGTVALGKRADLVLLNENPLQNIQSVSAPVGVMIGGRWLSREDIDRRMGERGDSVASLQERPSVP